MAKAQPKRASVAIGGFYSKCVGILGVILLVSLGKIYLERRTSHMGLEWERRHKELTHLLREIDNLRMEREFHLQGSYILKGARQMDLRPTEPGQVRRVTLKPSEYFSSGHRTPEHGDWHVAMRRDN